MLSKIIEMFLQQKRCDYNSNLVPDDYVCCDCEAHGVKLWREYNTVLVAQSLKCANCSLREQNQTGPVDDEGYNVVDGRRTDSIGWRIPAVPTEENDTFWGYTSVPQDGVNWWKRLPTGKGSYV